MDRKELPSMTHERPWYEVKLLECRLKFSYQKIMMEYISKDGVDRILEEIDYPTFEVTVRIGDKVHVGEISLELEGRDIYTQSELTEVINDKLLGDVWPIVEAMYETPAYHVAIGRLACHQLK